VDARDVTASPSKDLLLKLIRFGQIWEKLRRNLGKSLIRFGQNQNLISPKTFDLLWLCVVNERELVNQLVKRIAMK